MRKAKFTFKNIDDTIDEIVVSHLDSTNDSKKYGDYIDLDQYEKLRVVLKRQLLKRQQHRTKSAIFKHTKKVSIMDDISTMMDDQNKRLEENRSELSTYFSNGKDK